jgi:hypothetical protein
MFPLFILRKTRLAFNTFLISLESSRVFDALGIIEGF